MWDAAKSWKSFQEYTMTTKEISSAMFFEKVQLKYATFFVWSHTRIGLETQSFLTTVLLFTQSVLSTYKIRQ